MLLHYLKIAFRNIRKYKVQTVISIIGLALGLVCFSMSFLWLRYINSFEDFVPDAERIYLVGHKSTVLTVASSYSTPDIVSEVLVDNLPEAESVTKSTTISFDSSPSVYLALEGPDESKSREPMEPNFIVNEVADNYIDFFGMKVLAGDAHNIKDDEIVLTESTAKSLFGDADPIGQRVYVEYYPLDQSERYMTVKAIVADHPDNTQFLYDAMISLRPVPENRKFYNYNFYTFFKLREGVDAEEVQRKLKDITYEVPSWAENEPASTIGFEFDIMPLRSLRTEYITQDSVVKTDYVRIFVIIGLLVIIFSVVNYILTMVSQIRSRSRQMAIRRLSGASTAEIVGLNVVESAVIFVVAALLGLIVSFLVLPVFKEYASISASDRRLLLAVIFYVLILISIGIIAVVCTTLIVVKRTQKTILHGHQSYRSSSMLDKVSCVLQLTLSLAMIFATLTMYCQLRYLTQSNAMGFKRSDIVGLAWLENQEEVKRKIEALPMVKEHLDSLAFIFPVNLSSSSNIGLLKADESVDTIMSVHLVRLKERQIKFWGLDVIEGRAIHDGNQEIMVNESALRAFGKGHGVGTSVDFNGKCKIVGVLANIYSKSPLIEPEPVVFVSDFHISMMNMFDSFLAYKIYPGQKEDFKKAVMPYAGEGGWNIYDIEEKYNDLLKSEFMLMRLLTVIALCGIFVSIMGAYSVISLSLQARRKEMALRKVNGAKPRIIMQLYLKTNLYSLLIASVVAFPLVYVIMQRWLEQYPKHIGMPWLLIPVIMLVVAVLITLTVISKVYKASKENPADVLKE